MSRARLKGITQEHNMNVEMFAAVHIPLSYSTVQTSYQMLNLGCKIVRITEEQKLI